jgi:hypothetical protein
MSIISGDEHDQSFITSDNQNMSIMEEQNTESSQSNLILNENDEYVFEDILEEFESEPEVNLDYPNEAYSDLMTLVTKYKVNNKTGNAMIKFFNKHANLITSPLPKSIEQGRQYMDNMSTPHLIYNKTCVISYNNKEYYLHHRSLINCIKNILSIPNISQDFELKFKNLKVIIFSLYILFII